MEIIEPITQTNTLVDDASIEIADSELSKRLRIQINNTWPNKKLFEIEKVFQAKLQSLNIPEGFRPVKIKMSTEEHYQKSIAYLLDALDFMPNRPDLAFDFIWRAIDFLSRKVADEFSPEILNDKGVIKYAIENIWKKYLDVNIDVGEQMVNLINHIPVQSCEYLFKRMYFNYNETKPNNPNQVVSRLIDFDGGAVRDLYSQKIIENIKIAFPYNNSEKRRKGNLFIA